MSINNQKIKFLSQKILDPSIDCQSRASLSHPHLFNAIDANIPSTLYFEYCNLTLSQLISQRKPARLFIERDLLALLRGLTSCLAYLQKKGVSHGNIHPSRIFFDVQTGIFKIYDEELLLGENRSFLEAKAGKRSFLPPEFIHFYRNNQVVELKGTSFKSDVFALGLSAIEAATLKPSEEIYEVGSLTINATKIERRLFFIMKHYSREIAHVLRLMVEIDEEVRPDPIELYAILGCHDGESDSLETEIPFLKSLDNRIESKPSIDLRKSWGTFENLYKDSGLTRVSEDRLRKSLIEQQDKKENDVMASRSKNNLTTSCIFPKMNKENVL